MSWNLEEAIAYYRAQGAPADQSALVNFMKELQQKNEGGIPLWVIPQVAEGYGIKESFLLALIKRIPSLRLADTHCLVLCGGPNCSKQGKLAEFVEKTYGSTPEKFELKYSGCMRMCGKGPNIKWDGKLYHQADENLIRHLVEGDTEHV